MAEPQQQPQQQPPQQPQQQCNLWIPYSGTYTCSSYCQSDTPHCSPEPKQAYIQNTMMQGPTENIPPQCMTEEEVAAANARILSDCESYVPPKKASKNCRCDCNNFIESETGYRQATKCVCAPCKSSHIHFVT